MLILFVTELAQTRAHSTIRSYLAGVRHFHIMAGFKSPLQPAPRLDLALKGIQQVHPRRVRARLPITPLILQIIGQHLHLSDPDDLMLWAACCLGFFGFLRCAEFTVPAATKFDANKHLAIGDVAVDSTSQPSVLAVTIKMSKTDQFGRGTTIYLGRTDKNICPVAAILQYIAVRGFEHGPLFRTRTGQPLTRELLVARLRSTLAQAGIDASKYSGHSFRIGAATTAAAGGISDALIKTLGRWASNAYHLYVKVPRSELSSVSRTLVLQV